MERCEFEAIVAKAMERVPRRFRLILEREGIPVLARDRAPRALQRRMRGRWLFGLFTGTPYTQRSVFDLQTEPARIEIYRESFEAAYGDPKEPEEMEAEIARTVVHEIGHFFGFSEKELRRRNL